MGTEIKVSLSEDLLRALNRRLGSKADRSAFIEEAVWSSLARSSAQPGRDAEILDRNADRLNEEAEDVLEYQALP
jgi:metal-responsive CopG/Arc/MetJ family transcriptional regulator